MYLRKSYKITHPLTQIKWMCYDVFITIDKVVVNQDFNVCEMRLNNTTYEYFVDGKFRSQKWINENCANVLGFIDND